MGDAGILVELWKGGGGWLVGAGIAWMLIQKLSPSIIGYINAKAVLAKRMTEAVERLLAWPDEVRHRFENIERRLEDLTDLMGELVTVLGITLRPKTKPNRPIPHPKEGNDQK